MMTEPPVVVVLRRIDPVLAGLRGVRVERLRHYADAIALFDRCMGLHHAIIHLVAGNYVHEAAILTRPLMTDSMFLTDIAAGDERYRAEALVGWELATIADWEGIIKEGVARGQGDGSQLAVFDRRRQWLGKYLEGTGLFESGEMPRHRRPDGDVKRIADALGRGDESLITAPCSTSSTARRSRFMPVTPVPSSRIRPRATWRSAGRPGRAAVSRGSPDVVGSGHSLRRPCDVRIAGCSGTRRHQCVVGRDR